MKTSTLILAVSFFLCTYIATANHTLDSLRQVVLSPKLESYQKTIKAYTDQINGSTNKTDTKYFAQKIIDASNDLMDEIRELYGCKTTSEITPVYVGANAQTIYPNLGGYIFPVTYTTVGKKPDVYEEIDYIKSYAWKIRMTGSGKIVNRNVKKIEAKRSVLTLVNNSAQT